MQYLQFPTGCSRFLSIGTFTFIFDCVSDTSFGKAPVLR